MTAKKSESIKQTEWVTLTRNILTFPTGFPLLAGLSLNSKRFTKEDTEFMKSLPKGSLRKRITN